jgi:hypothetical protein
VQDYYTHNIETLLKSAGLDLKLNDDIKIDIDLGANWEVVTRWTELTRYERNTQAAAEEIHKAITHPDHGVLPWLKQSW